MPSAVGRHIIEGPRGSQVKRRVWVAFLFANKCVHCPHSYVGTQKRPGLLSAPAHIVVL